MEIYRNSEPTVEIDVPLTSATYTVSVVNSDGTKTPVPNASNLPADTDRSTISFTVPFEYTQFDYSIDLEVTMQRQDGGGGNVTFEVTIDVVTPLFTWRDLDGSYKKEETPELERLVRHVIEAYTGRSFGKTIERHVVDSGSNVLQFSQPLIEFRGISDRYVTHTTTLSPPKMPYEVFNDGFGLAIDWAHYDIKSDSMWILDRKCPKHYVIEGTFGYHNVPADVKQAALLIAGMWGCDQAVWRDRYIQTMRSSDWSVTYSDRGFEKTTGSVTADLLLDKYSRKYVPEVI